jgi:hypothetical protein
VSVEDEQVVALLRRAVGEAVDTTGISPERAARTGRRRAALRTATRVGAAALVASVLVVAATVVPRLVDRAAPAGPSVSVTPSPTQNPVRRLYAAYDAAVERNGLPLVDTRWTVDAYVRMGAPGEPLRFDESRTLHNFATAEPPVAFQTVELHEQDVLRTDEQLCGPYRANGFSCDTSSPAAGLTLVVLTADGAVRTVELWHPRGVVTASQPDGDAARTLTEQQLLDVALDPALRW